MDKTKLACFSRGLSCTVLALMLTVVSYSASAQQTDNRVDPAICDAQQAVSDAAQVGDNATIQGTITRPEPTAGLTCLDQAMSVTARLGNIFSDRHDAAVPPANTVVFTPPLAYPDFGAGDFLLRNLDTAITPMLGSYLGSNFTGTIAALLGATSISSKLTDLIGSVTGTIDQIASQINGFSGQINSILGAINTIQTLAKALNLPMPSPVIIGAVAALEAAQRVAAQLMGALQSAMNAAIQPLIGQVMGEIMAPTTDMECENIATLWGAETDVQGIHAIQGSGANPNVPFMSLTQLISGAFGSAGGGFMDQLQLSGNMDVLDRALNVLTQGALSRPGLSDSWRRPPQLSRNVSSYEVIQLMNQAPMPIMDAR